MGADGKTAHLHGIDQPGREPVEPVLTQGSHHTPTKVKNDARPLKGLQRSVQRRGEDKEIGGVESPRRVRNGVWQKPSTSGPGGFTARGSTPEPRARAVIPKRRSSRYSRVNRACQLRCVPFGTQHRARLHRNALFLFPKPTAMIGGASMNEHGLAVKRRPEAVSFTGSLEAIHRGSPLHHERQPLLV